MVKATRRSIDAALGRRSLPRSSSPPSPFAAPKTSINGPLTRQRVFAMTSLSLPAVKAIKAHHDVKVNDVVLALCAGALRRWFEDRGEDLSGPLVAMVPVSVRTEGEKGAMGNRVSSMLVSLATEVSDPALRLQVIGDATREAKERHAVGADALTDWAEFAAPALLGRAARLYSRMQLANLHRPVFNVTISNVPGPPFPLYSAGARLVANYPMGPIFDGAGPEHDRHELPGAARLRPAGRSRAARRPVGPGGVPRGRLGRAGRHRPRAGGRAAGGARPSAPRPTTRRRPP